MSEDCAVDDAYPMHSEEAFYRGIQYEARYIGSMDVARPQSRAEIVAAMRRVRFEFKAKAAKKRKVVIAISLDGVSLIFKRPPKPWHEGVGGGGGAAGGCGQLLMHHPIYRIFYVSHDSQDLKIFSYIARDSHRNAFKCNVFKAAKKVQAVRIVRTIGQAFEICHQLSMASKEHQQQQQQQQQLKKQQQAESVKSSAKLETPTPREPQLTESTVSVATETSPSWEELQLLMLAAAGTDPAGSDSSEACDCQTMHWRRHSRQLMQQNLEHRAQQTQAALAEAQLLRDQLAAESAARTEAQARAQRLLAQNRDLLDHLNQLVHRTRALELRLHHQQQQQPAAFRCSSSQSSYATLRSESQQQQQQQSLRQPATRANNDSFENDYNDDVSPDSGHKEMSSDSLSQALSLTLEPTGAAAPPPPPPQMQQRRTVPTPGSLDCRPHSWKPAASAAAPADAVQVSSLMVAAATNAAAALSGPAVTSCWSERFDADEPSTLPTAVAAHLNHSFEWSGEAAGGPRK